MSVFNPFQFDSDQAKTLENGYASGFAEPEIDHLPPLAPDVLDILSPKRAGEGFAQIMNSTLPAKEIWRALMTPNQPLDFF